VSVNWRVTFYSAAFQEEVLQLPAGFVARFLRYAERMELYGPDLGLPHTRAMGEGLFELRLKAAEGIARVFYCTLVGRRIVMLHQFIKKAEKTPRKEIEIARKRMKEGKMRNSLKAFRARALARVDVRREYDALAEEFEFLDEILKARVAAGLTQAEVAARIGTTQSAVARLEAAIGKHSPSIATLKRYASALGYRLQVRLVKDRGLTTRSTRTRAKTARAG